MVYSEYTKLRILHFHAQGCRPPAITKWLERNGIAVSRRGVAKFIKRFLRRGTSTIAWQPGSGRETKITDDIQRVVEHQMHQNDETTASQVHVLLSSLGYNLDLRTILCCRTALGWTFRGSAYCQLICNVIIGMTDSMMPSSLTKLESHHKQCWRTGKKQAKVSNTHK